MSCLTVFNCWFCVCIHFWGDSGNPQCLPDAHYTKSKFLSLAAEVLQGRYRAGGWQLSSSSSFHDLSEFKPFSV